MQIPSHFRQPHSASYFKKNAREPMDQENNTGRAQQIEVTAETTSAKITSGHDLTRMSSADMLGLASSFHEQGNIQDFLSLAVFSARAALEDHPDPYVRQTWTTPRNEDGTFNLLAELQAEPKNRTGSFELDAQNKAEREHLLNTLLSLSAKTITPRLRSLKSIDALKFKPNQP